MKFNVVNGRNRLSSHLRAPPPCAQRRGYSGAGGPADLRMRGRCLVIGAETFVRSSEHLNSLCRRHQSVLSRQREVGADYHCSTNLAHHRPEYLVGSRCYRSFPSVRCEFPVCRRDGRGFLPHPSHNAPREGLGNSSSPKPRSICVRTCVRAEVRIT